MTSTRHSASYTPPQRSPGWLEPGDWTHLAARASRIEYSTNEVIIAEGAPSPGLHVIVDGFVRIDRQGAAAGIAIARLGPGEAFGEMSLLEDSPAGVSVTAEGPVTIDRVSPTELRALLTADAPLAARIYRALAVNLSSRLRRTTAQLAKHGVADVSSAPKVRTALTGLVSDRQIPPALSYAVAEFRGRLWQVEEDVAEHPLTEPQPAVSSACDELIDAFASSLRDESAGGDRDAVAAGLGAYVFREVFSAFMASATVARCHTKPSGYPDDAETVERLYADSAEGDGLIGPLVDRWFLSRPTCRSRREARARVATAIRETIATATPAAPALILSLSCRAPHEIVDALAGSTLGNVTLMDGDELALRAGAELLAQHGLARSVLPVHANVASVVEGHGSVALAGQQLIYGIALCDTLDDDALLRVLDWCHERLTPGGRLLVSQTQRGGNDRPLMDHLIEWPVVGRSGVELRGLFARSRFAGNVIVASDNQDVCLWATATR